MSNIYYRVCVVNDYTNTKAYAEYNSFGNGHLQVFNCAKASGPINKYQTNTDEIRVYLNFELQGSFKDKTSAKRLLEELVTGCPRDAKRDFETYSAPLFNAVT